MGYSLELHHCLQTLLMLAAQLKNAHPENAQIQWSIDKPKERQSI